MGVDALDLEKPVLVERVEPLYPPPLRQARVQGYVILQAVIAVDGSVTDVEVLRATHGLFEDSARRAVSRWLYRPGRLAGRLVPVRMTVTVRFTLS